MPTKTAKKASKSTKKTSKVAKTAKTTKKAKSAPAKSSTKHAAPKTQSVPAKPQRAKNEKSLTYVIIAVLVLLVAGWAFMVTQDQATLQHTQSSAIIATIEGYEVTQQDVDDVGVALRQLYPWATQDQIVNQTLIIVYLRGLAQDAGFSADEQEVQILVEQRKLQLEQQFTDEEFVVILESINLTEDKFFAVQEQAVRDDLEINAYLQQEVFDQLDLISDAEALQYYRDNQNQFTFPERRVTRHILICYEGTQFCEQDTAQRDALAEIERLQRELEDNLAEFSNYAQTYSTGPTGANGGQLGEVTRGQMVPAFEEAVFSAQAGVLSDVVETDFGYHLILVDDIKPASVTPYEEVKQDITQNLEAQQLAQTQASFVEELMSNAEVVYR